MQKDFARTRPKRSLQGSRGVLALRVAGSLASRGDAACPNRNKKVSTSLVTVSFCSVYTYDLHHDGDFYWRKRSVGHFLLMPPSECTGICGVRFNFTRRRTDLRKSEEHEANFDPRRRNESRFDVAVQNLLGVAVR